MNKETFLALNALPHSELLEQPDQVLLEYSQFQQDRGLIPHLEKSLKAGKPVYVTQYSGSFDYSTSKENWEVPKKRPAKLPRVIRGLNGHVICH